MTPEQDHDLAEWLKAQNEQWVRIVNFWQEYAKTLEAEIVFLRGESHDHTKH